MRKKEKGFTLLELVIYTAIAAMVLAVLVSLLLVLMRTWNRTAPQADVRQNVSFALSRITDRVNNASAVVGTYPSDALDLAIAGKTTRFSVNSGVLTYDDDITDALPGQALSGSSVSVAKCAEETSYFFKLFNSPPAKDSVRFCLKISYNDNGLPERAFSQELRTSATLR